MLRIIKDSMIHTSQLHKPSFCFTVWIKFNSKFRTARTVKRLKETRVTKSFQIIRKRNGSGNFLLLQWCYAKVSSAKKVEKNPVKSKNIIITMMCTVL